MKRKMLILMTVLAVLSVMVFASCSGGEDNTAATKDPQANVTDVPQGKPTEAPTEAPTDAPTEAPTATPAPTAIPTEAPDVSGITLPKPILDVSFDEKGIVDNSETKFDIDEFGDPSTKKSDKIGIYVMDCQGGTANEDGANYIVKGIADYYDTLKKSFTWEVYCMCSDDYQEMYPMSNLHAGGVSIGLDPNEIEGDIFALVENGGSYAEPDFGPYKLNEYMHLVLTFDGTTCVGYFNGTKVCEEKVSGFYFTSENGAKYVGIGADSCAAGTGEYFWCGEIALGRIYSEALTAEQVMKLYVELPKG